MTQDTLLNSAFRKRVQHEAFEIEADREFVAAHGPLDARAGGANAETWTENAAKWHQLPLFVVALCGVVEAPWILGALMYGAFASAAGPASLCAIRLWARSIAIVVGVASSNRSRR
ncbi:MAG: hypothetical protein ACOH2Q_07110 [Rhodococcus sp. (in: high G+C Gram-positive bacteria)]